jgi:hypothetical protein
MPNGLRASKDVDDLFPLAEKELRAFVHAVDQLFGAEQAQRSAFDWIHEIEVMNWPVEDAIPSWRQATIKASARLCRSHPVNLRRSPTKIDGWR